MNMMFTYALADRLADTVTTAYCLHPGFVRRKFGHNKSGFAGLVLRLSQIVLAISPEAGAKTSLCLATARELVDINAQDFEKFQAAPSWPESRNRAAQERLWQISAKQASAIP
jgi:NAD(P)-dependent dehydrogenase (short-subunit alcohol dehydrogenase family)